MTLSPISKTVSLANLLLKLHRDETTGVVTVKDERRTLRIYFQDGGLVYADGIDTESRLLKEIAAKKKMDPDRVAELHRMRRKDPHSLGKALIEQKLIPRSQWKKFLHLKPRHVLTAALAMQAPDLGFSAAALQIPPDHFVALHTPQLLLDTLRGIRVPKDFFDGADRFTPSQGAEEAAKDVPLNLSEQTVLSLVDGQKTVAEIASLTDLDKRGLHGILYLLLATGLIQPAPRGGRGEKGVDYQEMVTLYLDLLTILDRNFRREADNAFDKVLSSSLDALPAQSRAFMANLRLNLDSREAVVGAMIQALSSQGTGPESRLFLQTSFNKLIFLLILQMKKRLGMGPTKDTISEMTGILEYVEKYRQDTDLLNHVRENLNDYLKQIQS